MRVGETMDVAGMFPSGQGGHMRVGETMDAGVCFQVGRMGICAHPGNNLSGHCPPCFFIPCSLNSLREAHPGFCGKQYYYDNY